MASAGNNLIVKANEDIDINIRKSAHFSIEVKGKATAQISVCSKIAKNYVAQFSKMLGSLEKVVIHNDENLRRGLSNKSIIYLRCLPDHDEFLNVLIHEIGHVVDLGYLKGSKKGSKSSFDDFGTVVTTDDESYLFYSISWKNNTDLNRRITPSAFVSSYSSSDPFEDFAETFMLYVRYNSIFNELAKENHVLKLKYDFMASIIDDLKLNDVILVQNSEQVIDDLDLITGFLRQNSIYDATQIHKKLLVYL